MRVELRRQELLVDFFCKSRRVQRTLLEKKRGRKRFFFLQGAVRKLGVFKLKFSLTALSSLFTSSFKPFVFLP